jgi:DNA repair ATPase RecN
MKQVRDVNACIARLRALQGRSDTEPEQTKYIDEAIEELRKLRRKSNPSKAEVFRCVRKVTDNLLRAFGK